jgi:hypothetical protein
MNNHEYMACVTCIEYAEGRTPVLIPAMHERRMETGETSQQILDRYMTGVHKRHMNGLSLAVSA